MAHVSPMSVPLNSIHSDPRGRGQWYRDDCWGSITLIQSSVPRKPEMVVSLEGTPKDDDVSFTIRLVPHVPHLQSKKKNIYNIPISSEGRGN